LSPRTVGLSPYSVAVDVDDNAEPFATVAVPTGVTVEIPSALPTESEPTG
jgi:hypothetical protein